MIFVSDVFCQGLPAGDCLLRPVPLSVCLLLLDTFRQIVLSTSAVVCIMPCPACCLSVFSALVLLGGQCCQSGNYFSAFSIDQKLGKFSISGIPVRSYTLTIRPNTTHGRRSCSFRSLWGINMIEVMDRIFGNGSVWFTRFNTSAHQITQYQVGDINMRLDRSELTRFSLEDSVCSQDALNEAIGFAVNACLYTWKMIILLFQLNITNLKYISILLDTH